MVALRLEEPSTHLPEVVAAIDIGTNSVHLVVARVTGSGRFEVLTREKDVVRLGASAGDMKRLAPDAMDRGIAALTRCRKLAETWDAEIVAVATSAVREAENRQEFLDRARDEAGIEVAVISGYEEARLIHLGVLQSVPVFDQRLLLCDIGGGSTELLVGEGGDVRFARSLKIGAIRVTERFFHDGHWTRKRVAVARQFLEDLLSGSARAIRAEHPEVFVASSGTAETIVAMALATGRGDERPRSLSGSTVDRDDVTRVVELLVESGDAEAARELPGIDPKRADILLGGALVLEAVMGAADASELVFSDAALREGVLFDAVERWSGERRTHHLSNIRRQGVLHLMELCEEDPDHALQSARLACRIFEQLADRLGLPPESEELLEAAALLANVGLFISHSRHHQHSYYVIRNAECLTGFIDAEVEVIAQVARYHRRSAPSLRHPPFAALGDDEQQLVRALAGILRIAVGLDRAHAAAVREVEVDQSGDGAVIRVTGADGADVSLDVWSAAQRTDLLADVLGCEVTVEAA